MLSRLITLGLCLHMTLMNVSQAEELDDYIESDRWVVSASVGFGRVGVSQGDRKDIPLYLVPDIRYYGEQVTLENTSISYALKQTPEYQIEMLGRQNFDGLSFRGSHRGVLASSGLIIGFEPTSAVPTRSRSMSYMGGVSYTYFLASGSIEADVTKDISNVHHGYEFRLGYKQDWQWWDWHFQSLLRATYKSGDLLDYYYGSEGVKEVPVSLEGHRFSARAQLQAARQIEDNIWLVGAYSLQWMSAAALSSPFTKDSPLDTYFLGVKWVF
ncbi:MipA/OmpV family protein [Pseudoalteromonas sp. T1lg88]|uniref:MipA/OmpV family protein n=1 Tax=Pseudoalteromonas sp. T1lg88 TaxID=2077104 RepID=UPI000CF6E042|nr:MipA/OmpV family protein [Pseudoalteromonas sp. T1lg88]